MKKFKENLAKFLNKAEKGYYTFIMTIVATTTMTNIVHAGQPKLVSGTVALFAAISGWLLIIIPGGAGAILGWHAFQKTLTDDQATIAEKNKLMKNVIIAAAVAETASGIITIVLNFYK